ncbi:MAG: hypothetical protein HRU77_05475 [Gammaproteobacteria bacterium]|jgi:hypothetical protein|nr:MAG: hypothetical protein HRU77_05475 [Gammaproteobacteria bacterium]
MRIPRNPFTLLAVSVFIALSTILVEKLFWYIGYLNNLQLLSILALMHVVVSALIIIDNPGKLLLRLGTVVIFIIGQQWLIELIAMLIIWQARGFAP